MLKLFHYLFSPPLLKKQLPLAPSQYSSDSGRVPIEPGQEQSIKALINNSLAREPYDAWRLLNEYPDWPVERIIKDCKRRRKHQGRVELARERVRRLW